MWKTGAYCERFSKYNGMKQLWLSSVRTWTFYARQVTWLVTARIQALQPTTQGFAATAISQATLLPTAQTRRACDNCRKLTPSPWLVIAPTKLSATPAIYRVMLPDSAPSQSGLMLPVTAGPVSCARNVVGGVKQAYECPSGRTPSLLTAGQAGLSCRSRVVWLCSFFTLNDLPWFKANLVDVNSEVALCELYSLFLY